MRANSPSRLNRLAALAVAAFTLTGCGGGGGGDAGGGDGSIGAGPSPPPPAPPANTFSVTLTEMSIRRPSTGLPIDVELEGVSTGELTFDD